MIVLLPVRNDGRGFFSLASLFSFAVTEMPWSMLTISPAPQASHGTVIHRVRKESPAPSG